MKKERVLICASVVSLTQTHLATNSRMSCVKLNFVITLYSDLVEVFGLTVFCFGNFRSFVVINQEESYGLFL